MLFQKYKIELTTLYKLGTILIDDAFVNYKYYLRYLVIGHKQNFSEQIDLKKSTSSDLIWRRTKDFSSSIGASFSDPKTDRCA